MSVSFYLNGNIYKTKCSLRCGEVGWGDGSQQKALMLNLPLKIFTFSVVIELFIVASFAGEEEKNFTIACGEVLMGSKKETSNLFLPARRLPLEKKGAPTSVSCRLVKCWMIFCECFMLMAVNFAWRNARVLHHFISTNEPSNEKYFFRLSSIAIATAKRMNFLLFPLRKCFTSTKILHLMGRKKKEKKKVWGENLFSSKSAECNW